MTSSCYKEHILSIQVLPVINIPGDRFMDKYMYMYVTTTLYSKMA